MTGILTREQILASQDLKKERVPVPEWGGDVFVRVMTGTERDAFEETIFKGGGSNIGTRARLAALTMIDEKGQRLFTDEDVQVLGEKSAPALDRVYTASIRLIVFTDHVVVDLEIILGAALSGFFSFTLHRSWE